MKEIYWKKYWKIAVAAVFLTAAGFCYGGMQLKDGGIPLKEPNGAGWTAEAGGLGDVETTGQNGVSESAGTMSESGGMSAVENGSGDAFRQTDGTGDSLKAKLQTKEAGAFVHICGQVKAPGVYELPKDSRIFEAVDAAGGFTEDAAADLLNLAEKIYDGMKLMVFSKEEAEALTEEERLKLFGAGAGGIQGFGESRSSADRASAGLVNINTAPKEELMTLSGIGGSRAEDIIRYREESGGFKRIEDIMKVPGIKDAGFQKIKDSITV